MKHILGGTGSLIHSWHYNWHVEGPSYVKVGHRIVYDYAVPFSAKLSSVITKSDSFWLAARSDELVVVKIVCVFVLICVCVSIESSLTGLGVGERRSWDVCFTQEFNDWEMDEGVNFIRILGANFPSMDVGDRMRWKLKSNGDFDIHSFYNKLQGNPSIGFPWKVIGRVMGPRRISFFVWSV